MKTKDFVYAPKAVIGAMSTVFFIGTKDYIYTYPLEEESHSYRKVTTTDYLIQGEPAGDFLLSFVNKEGTTAQSIHELFSSFKPSELLLILDLRNAKKLKFKFSWLLGMIYVDNHIITKFGKSKDSIQAFYNEKG